MTPGHYFSLCEPWAMLGVLRRIVRIGRIIFGCILSSFFKVLGSWGEADIFRGQGAKVTFATRRARHWLKANVGEHVAFEDVATG
jgi:hypothetical protein